VVIEITLNLFKKERVAFTISGSSEEHDILDIVVIPRIRI